MSGNAADVVRAVTERLGHVDLLVNNAGVSGPVGMFWESNLEDW